jgi:hypothetical protein
VRIVLNTDDGDEIRAQWTSDGAALELEHDDPNSPDCYGSLRLSGIDLDNLITGLTALRDARPR